MIVVRHGMVSVTGLFLSSEGFGSNLSDAFQDSFLWIVVLVIELDFNIPQLFGSESTQFVDAVVEERIMFPSRSMNTRILRMIHDFVIVGFVVVDHKEITGSLGRQRTTEGLVHTMLLNSLFAFLCIC